MTSESHYSHLPGTTQRASDHPTIPVLTECALRLGFPGKIIGCFVSGIVQAGQARMHVCRTATNKYGAAGGEASRRSMWHRSCEGR